MDILKMVSHWSEVCPDKPAVISHGKSLTYRQLNDYSSRLALYLDGKCHGSKNPVVVYGHKHPFMLVCFLACAKSGRAYCPVDTSISDVCLTTILDSVNPPVLFALEKLPLLYDSANIITLSQLTVLLKEERMSIEEVKLLTALLTPVQGTDTFYVMFTSDSDQLPDGVQISAHSLNQYLEWSSHLDAVMEKQNTIMLNQAPFSFSLSVIDLYTALACGQTLWCLPGSIQNDSRLVIQTLKASRAGVLVSTPAFADRCLGNPSFNQKQLPEVRLFLFCKEILSNRTVHELQLRFPRARIFNTYAPAESAAFVTALEITPQINQTYSPLPVGYIKPGIRIEIHDSHKHRLPDEKKGEIVLMGDTVSSGYYKNDFNTRKVFFQCQKDGKVLQGCRTRDLGYIKKGMLFYCGRADSQVKLHGCKIELENIENSLLKLPQVAGAAVLPHRRGKRINGLYAYVICPEKEISDRSYAARLKEDLLSLLPEYMIPKRFFFLKQFPITGNGKIDKKALGNMLF